MREPSNRARFDKALVDLLESAPYTVVSAGIDKKLHRRHYTEPDHPYHYLLKVLLERFVMYLACEQATGDVIVESRGKKDDTRLKLEYERFYKSGNEHVPRQAVERRLVKTLTMVEREGHNVAGLQVADMLAFPSHLHLVSQVTDQPVRGEFTSSND